MSKLIIYKNSLKTHFIAKGYFFSLMANFFAITQQKFRIKNSDLAEMTGFSASYVSEIRNGKATPSFDGLIRWLEGAEKISPGSRQYFCQLLAGQSIESTIDRMDGGQIAQVLVAIADKLQSSPEPVAVKELLSA
jgi:transcriptional regulator with XRE-family HTH domain